MNAKAIKINFDTPILFKAGWNCCYGKETRVIVFDNGNRWAVCSSCSAYYTGPVWSLFIFNPDTFVTYDKESLSDICDDGEHISESFDNELKF